MLGWLFGFCRHFSILLKEIFSFFSLKVFSFTEESKNIQEK